MCSPITPVRAFPTRHFAGEESSFCCPALGIANSASQRFTARTFQIEQVPDAMKGGIWCASSAERASWAMRARSPCQLSCGPSGDCVVQAQAERHREAAQRRLFPHLEHSGDCTRAVDARAARVRSRKSASDVACRGALIIFFTFPHIVSADCVPVHPREAAAGRSHLHGARRRAFHPPLIAPPLVPMCSSPCLRPGSSAAQA